MKSLSKLPIFPEHLAGGVPCTFG